MVAAGGALAGRVTEIGPDSATVVLLTDAESTVIGQLAANAATGEVVGQLGGVLVMSQIDSSDRVGLGDEVVTAGIELASGDPLAVSEGPADRPGRRRPARRERRRPDGVPQPTADLDKLEYVLVILDYEGGLPPIEQQPVDCSDGRARCPSASSRASRRRRPPLVGSDAQALTPGWYAGSRRRRAAAGESPRRRDDACPPSRRVAGRRYRRSSIVARSAGDAVGVGARPFGRSLRHPGRPTTRTAKEQDAPTPRSSVQPLGDEKMLREATRSGDEK